MIEQNLAATLKEIGNAALQSNRKPEDVLLLVVTKNQPWSVIEEVYRCGCRDFGENRVQEALEKMENAPSDVRWHFIGKLQKNKVAKVVGNFLLIHSVDSIELAEKISEISLQKRVISSILLEANTSGEETKGGLNPEQWKREFSNLLQLNGIEIHGLMTMAPYTNDEGVIRRCFSELRHLRDDLQEIAGNRAQLSTLSMGMSNDFHLAIQEGSTIVRLGTAIFSPHGVSSEP